MSKPKLLLADDSLTIQKVVNLTFADEGIEVFTVSDGDAAMRKFNEVAPDLVLADVNMPGPDGYQICEAIKQDELTKHIPVILLVGSFEPFDEEKARSVGADDFLTKPFQSIRQLVSRVSDLLEGKTDGNDFPLPVENETVSDGSFGGNLEMPPNEQQPDTVAESSENLGDVGMDDEMIQSSQIGSLPIDEVHRFESAPVYQSFAEDLDPSSIKSPYNSEIIADYPPDENWAKTQPLSKADLEEFRKVSGTDKTTPDLNFDELDLLEIPQVTDSELTEREISSASAAPPNDFTLKDETIIENQNVTGEIVDPQIETVNNTIQPEHLSAESVEAIASRVVEKLSGRVIKQIVREVIAQMERRK